MRRSTLNEIHNNKFIIYKIILFLQMKYISYIFLNLLTRLLMNNSIKLVKLNILLRVDLKINNIT